jgi:hypothetical protein
MRPSGIVVNVPRGKFSEGSPPRTVPRGTMQSCSASFNEGSCHPTVSFRAKRSEVEEPPHFCAADQDRLPYLRQMLVRAGENAGSLRYVPSGLGRDDTSDGERENGQRRVSSGGVDEGDPAARFPHSLPRNSCILLGFPVFHTFSTGRGGSAQRQRIALPFPRR